MWEIAKKIEEGQLTLDRPLEDWLDAALAAPGSHVAEMTRTILVESSRLVSPFHGDPADQILVATCRGHGASLVTRDSRLRDYPHVRTIW